MILTNLKNCWEMRTRANNASPIGPKVPSTETKAGEQIRQAMSRTKKQTSEGLAGRAVLRSKAQKSRPQGEGAA